MCVVLQSRTYSSSNMSQGTYTVRHTLLYALKKSHKRERLYEKDRDLGERGDCGTLALGGCGMANGGQ